MPEELNNSSLVTPILKGAGEVVRLSKKSLIKDKEDGLTNPELAKKYNLSPTSISKALKIAGLSHKKAKAKAKFVVVED